MIRLTIDIVQDGEDEDVIVAPITEETEPSEHEMVLARMIIGGVFFADEVISSGDHHAVADLNTLFELGARYFDESYVMHVRPEVN